MSESALEKAREPAATERPKCRKHGVVLEEQYESCSCEYGERESWDFPGKWVKCHHCDGAGERSRLWCWVCEEEDYDY